MSFSMTIQKRYLASTKITHRHTPARLAKRRIDVLILDLLNLLSQGV
jgi:hypothetical protein